MLNLPQPNIEDPDEALIWLYLLIDQAYRDKLFLSCQRFSNNDTPIFSDVELLTTFLFGQVEGFRTQKKNYRYIKGHYSAWFPKLPTYEGWNKRLRLALDAFPDLIEYIATYLYGCGFRFKGYDIVDSLPIKLARGSRSSGASVASEIANKSYCDSRSEWYYGVKLHLQATAIWERLPILKFYEISSASEHDLTAWRSAFLLQENQEIYADKAYINHQLQEDLYSWNGVSLNTPHKKEKGQPGLPLFKQVDNTNHSRKRQPIESLFNWIEEKTGIQNASKVRSLSGLLLHIYSKLAVALVIMLIVNC